MCDSVFQFRHIHDHPRVDLLHQPATGLPDVALLHEPHLLSHGPFHFCARRVSGREVSKLLDLQHHYMLTTLANRILRKTLGPAVKRVWLAQDVEEVEEKVDERDMAAFKLEAAETKLIKSANANRMKEDKKGGRSSSSEGALEGGQGSSTARYLKLKQRPTHKLKFLIGKKVDTVDWCRGELRRLVPECQAMQAEHMAGRCKKLNSVFVEFTTCSEAQAAFQSLTHHQVRLTDGWRALKLRRVAPMPCCLN